MKIQQAVQEMLDTDDEDSDDDSDNKCEMPTPNPCVHCAVTEFFDCIEEEFSDALSVIESSDVDVFEDAGEMVSNLVEFEEVTEEELPNNQQVDETCVHEDNDDKKLYHFDAMDEEILWSCCKKQQRLHAL